MGSTSPSSKDFNPTDEELIQVFLCNKVNGKPLPSNVTILEYDLYGDKNPWEIWEEIGGSNSYGGKDLYFFTTLKKKFPNGSRSIRTIGWGSWEGEDVAKKVVVSETKQCIGTKKRFRFEKSDTIHDGAWIMHEYTVDPSLLNHASDNNYVLCRFRKNMKRNVHEEPSTERTSQEEIRVTKKMRTVVLALPAATVESNKSSRIVKTDLSREYIHQGQRNQPRNGDQLAKELSHSTETTSEQEEEDGDLLMSWPELFSLQLRNFKEFVAEEEDIFMPPDTFTKDLLSERIDKKYINFDN